MSTAAGLAPIKHEPTAPAEKNALFGGLFLFSGTATSSVVQVFGRRHDDPLHALWRPASKKRQGTKSREVGHRRCSGRYGDLMAAPSSMVDVTLPECGRRISRARLEAYNRHLSKRL